MNEISATANDIAATIDATLLSPTATAQDIIALSKKIKAYPFASLCVAPHNIFLAGNEILRSSIKICSVIGFPHGNISARQKLYEAATAVEDGAREIDVVWNIGAFKSGYFTLVETELSEIVKRCPGIIVKVIIETAYLSTDEIVKACAIVESSGAHFIKTSTGYAPRGASVDDIRQIKQTVGDRLKIKAAGGIATLAQWKAMREAGADRIGTSKALEIVAEAEKESR